MDRSRVWVAGTCLLALLPLLSGPPARAEEPLWGEIASTLGKGFFNVTTRGALRSWRPYQHQGGPLRLTIDRTDVVLGVEYGLLTNLDLHLRVPYFMETLDERSPARQRRHDLRGLGETEMGAKWRFFQRIGDRTKDELAFMVDVKLPTGNNDLRGRDGALITPHLQPNSGNLGAAIGLAANRHTLWGGYWFSTSFHAETASERVYRGTLLEVHLSTGRRFHRLIGSGQTDWMGIVGLHYHGMGKEKELGRPLRGSGGSVQSFELGLVGSHRNRGVRLGVLLPLHIDLGQSHAPPRHEIQAQFRASF